MRKFLKEIIPPIALKVYKKIINASKNFSKNNSKKNSVQTNSHQQDLSVYWDSEMAALLETWGKDHVWNEIQMFLVGKKGKVLDIACGTGVTIKIASKNKDLEVYGCDISDLLITKAVGRGIDKKYLQVCDAANMSIYPDDYFDYSYSIGSLEHFTEDGILKFIAEVQRITKQATFHMVPISRDGQNKGWIKTYQSYFNNNEQWWMDRFKSKYEYIYAIDSGWKDDISLGKWFVCIKKNDDS